MRYMIALILVALAAPANAQSTAEDYRSDAFEMVDQIEEGYAYRDRSDDGMIPFTPILRAEAEQVQDSGSLLRFAERLLLALRDHHAITGSSFSDSWAVIPSYADLWIVYQGGDFIVDAVREGSPAAEAGISPGMRLVRIGQQQTHIAVAAFWNDLGLADPDAEALEFAACLLAAGRRDRSRALGFAGDAGEISAQMPSLYALDTQQVPPVTLETHEMVATIRINNSLGDNAMIAAFDAAMAEAVSAPEIVLDLTETPSGGNTTIARAIMG